MSRDDREPNTACGVCAAPIFRRGTDLKRYKTHYCVEHKRGVRREPRDVAAVVPLFPSRKLNAYSRGFWLKSPFAYLLAVNGCEDREKQPRAA